VPPAAPLLRFPDLSPACHRASVQGTSCGLELGEVDAVCIPWRRDARRGQEGVVVASPGVPAPLIDCCPDADLFVFGDRRDQDVPTNRQRRGNPDGAKPRAYGELDP